MTSLPVWREYDLLTSLYPSFTYPFYEVRGSAAAKLYGHKRGAVIRHLKERGLVECRGCTREELALLSGAWFNPLERLRGLSRKCGSVASELLEVLPGLGLAIDPWDPLGVFVSAYLSRNTDFHANTVRWFRTIAGKALDEEELLAVDPRVAGSSYQLRQLAENRALVADAVRRALRSSPAEARRVLLRVPFSGPKTVNAFLLFSRGVTELSAADRHLLRFMRDAGLHENPRYPVKSACARYWCTECPLRRDCMTGVLMTCFGEAAGWVQTATYILGRRRALYSRVVRR